MSGKAQDALHTASQMSTGLFLRITCIILHLFLKNPKPHSDSEISRCLSEIQIRLGTLCFCLLNLASPCQAENSLWRKHAKPELALRIRGRCEREQTAMGMPRMGS